jgi:hypothetical protein
LLNTSKKSFPQNSLNVESDESDLKREVTKVRAHRRDTEGAEVFYKEIFSLGPLRLCGEPYKNDRIPQL